MKSDAMKDDAMICFVCAIFQTLSTKTTDTRTFSARNNSIYNRQSVCLSISKFSGYDGRVFEGSKGPRCQPKAGILACASCRQAYMLALLKI